MHKKDKLHFVSFVLIMSYGLLEISSRPFSNQIAMIEWVILLSITKFFFLTKTFLLHW